MRLSGLDELQQAAETGAEMRLQKEAKELGAQDESRIQQAAVNRKLLFKAHMQRMVAVQERRADFLTKRINRHKIYKNLIQAAICQKRAADGQKRMGFLEAEKTRAHGTVMRARRVVKSIFHQREMERRRMKEDLEERLQRVCESFILFLGSVANVSQ